MGLWRALGLVLGERGAKNLSVVLALRLVGVAVEMESEAVEGLLRVGGG